MADIGLIDLGSPRFPNLALMKISTYYRTQGASVALNSPGTVATFVSCIFSRRRAQASALVDTYGAAIGGPGWNPKIILEPGPWYSPPDHTLYGQGYGIGRLTEGCPAGCGFCVVPQTEGLVSRTIAHAGDLVNGMFLVLLDSNILACPDWIDHFREIREYGLTVCFTQGLDIRRVTELVARELALLKVRELHGQKPRMWFAWDRLQDEGPVRAGIAELQKAGIAAWRMRFYVLVGFDTTFEQDIYRVEVLRGLGADPFVMCYEGAGRRQRDLARWCNRPQLRGSCKFDEYEKTREENRRYGQCDGQLSLDLL